MQVYVSKFDQGVDLDIERVKRDVPDLAMESPIEIVTDGVPTVAFLSADGEVKYREIWFARGGRLYQVLAPAENDAMTEAIMQSWKWK